MAGPLDLNDLFGLSMNPQLLSGAPGNGMSAPVQAQYSGASDPAVAAAVQQSPTAAPAVPVGASAQDPNAPINVDAGWQPHHTTTLGKIADIGLALFGLPILPFTKSVQRKNMSEAMEGFSQDPLGTIQKMAKIPGMQDKAFQLYEQYSQIHANDAERAAHTEYYTNQNDAASRGTLASYMGAMGQAKDPDAVYQKMLPTLRAYAEKHNLPPELLPDTYDPDIAQSVMIGGIKPDKQMELGETSRFHTGELQARTTAIQSENAYRQARLGQIGQHDQQEVQHWSNQEQIARSRLPAGPPVARGLKPVTGLPPEPKVGMRQIVPVKGPDGQPVTDGVSNTLMQFESDGRWHAYQKSNGKINQVGTLSRAKDGHWYQD